MIQPEICPEYQYKKKQVTFVITYCRVRHDLNVNVYYNELLTAQTSVSDTFSQQVSYKIQSLNGTSHTIILC